MGMLKNLACLEAKPENLYFPPKKGDYEYFEGPPFRPNQGFHSSNASWAADASMFAYARYGKTRLSKDEFERILLSRGFTVTGNIGDCFVDKAITARGFLAWNEQFAVLAFRGTEKDNACDIKADLDIVLVPEALGGRSSGSVHRGFQNYLKAVWPRVTELVSAYRAAHKKQEICITGHSLGAALATLAFHQLQDDATSLYTFGSPRVGTRAFCKDLMAVAETRGCYRVVDNEDAVTHVPFNAFCFGYKHPKCTLFWIDPKGAVTENPPSPPSDVKDVRDITRSFLKGEVVDPIPGPLADHSPVRYCHWLSKQAASDRPLAASGKA